jgi:hypothetical protein
MHLLDVYLLLHSLIGLTKLVGKLCIMVYKQIRLQRLLVLAQDQSLLLLLG